MFTLKISTRNAAFNEGGDDGMQRNPGPELARILRKAADLIEQVGDRPRGPMSGDLIDYNGNGVGVWKLTNR